MPGQHTRIPHFELVDLALHLAYESEFSISDQHGSHLVVLEIGAPGSETIFSDINTERVPYFLYPLALTFIHKFDASENTLGQCAVLTRDNLV